MNTFLYQLILNMRCTISGPALSTIGCKNCGRYPFADYKSLSADYESYLAHTGEPDSEIFYVFRINETCCYCGQSLEKFILSSNEVANCKTAATIETKKP